MSAGALRALSEEIDTSPPRRIHGHIGSAPERSAWSGETEGRKPWSRPDAFSPGGPTDLRQPTPALQWRLVSTDESPFPHHPGCGTRSPGARASGGCHPLAGGAVAVFSPGPVARVARTHGAVARFAATAGGTGGAPPSGGGEGRAAARPPTNSSPRSEPPRRRVPRRWCGPTSRN